MNTNPLVTCDNGKVITTSLIVADVFEKEHNHVLRDIRDLVEQIGDLSKIGQISEEQTPILGNGYRTPISQMFIESTYPDAYGRQQPMFQMTRDGFTLLAMGFTGEKALKFKLDFIAAFNAMEQTLKNAIAPAVDAAPQFIPTDFQRGRELAKLARTANDPAMKQILVAKAANLLSGEELFPVDELPALNGKNKKRKSNYRYEPNTIDVENPFYDPRTEPPIPRYFKPRNR